MVELLDRLNCERMAESQAAAELRAALASLIADTAASRECWTVFRRFLESHCAEFTSHMERYTAEEDQIAALATMLIPIARMGFSSGSHRSDLFKAAEKMGVHIMPVHFYSPVPNLQAIPEAAWNHQWRPARGFRWDTHLQFETLLRLGKWGPELSSVPLKAAGPGDFYWGNPALSRGDATIYYSMIREYRPAQVVEIGSGYSSMLAARACLLNGITKLSCIEPYPMAALEGLAGLTELIKAPVQDLPPAWFDRLAANDILFVDSTHVSKIGSDVNYLILDVLPRLKPGVLVHFHDIFLPYQMPRPWLMDQQLMWNEQYLLSAFLLFNDAFEVMCANHWLGRDHPDAFLKAFPAVNPPGGASFWMRRR